MTLAKARDAIVAGDLAKALDALLAAWRKLPAVELADLVASVGDRARRDVLPPSGRTAHERDAAWHALAKRDDAVTRGMLVEHLAGNMAETLARIELLAAGPFDPRFAAKVGDFVERPLFNAALPRTTAFWRRIFEILPSLGDPRLVVRARQFPAIWPTLDMTRHELTVFPKRFARAIPALEAAYGAGPPALPADALAICREIAEALAARDDSAAAALVVAHDAQLEGRTTLAREILAEVPEEALVEAIYLDPDDDARRHAYADWLVRKGDPRGEFIALQLARRDDRPSKRERDLLARHKTIWLGPLAQMVKTPTATFHRGFLDMCALKGTWTQRLDDDPRWATVRSIELGNSGMIQLAKIARPLVVENLSWELRSAQGLEYGHEAAIEAFCTLRLPRLRRVSIWGFYFMGRFDRKQIEAAPVAAQLHSLEIDVG
jgi:uncharacterized protein (TIGR02996 family)